MPFWEDPVELGTLAQSQLPRHAGRQLHQQSSHTAWQGGSHAGQALLATPGKKGAPCPAKGPKSGKNATKEEDDSEEDEDEEEGEEKNNKQEDDEYEKDEDEEEPIKEVPRKQQKEMTKKEAASKAKGEKVEASETTTSSHLLVGNPNDNKSFSGLKTGASDVFPKNDLAVVDVRIGTSCMFGYVDFESAEELEKTLALTGLKIFALN
ncbi:Nucleolin [Tupaia chinensis]|uniref:Nucleolin n=1 Tax=Tupaia chinensis TaxID=246437 RepID=L9KLB5_TUPCH|nr:Nucleolin [Tupaia chinensis]